MIKISLYLSFACLTGFTVINESPAIAGGCSSHMNKTSKIKCAENETECETEKAKKFNLKESLNS